MQEVYLNVFVLFIMPHLHIKLAVFYLYAVVLKCDLQSCILALNVICALVTHI